jgi:hypothetical protein
VAAERSGHELWLPAGTRLGDVTRLVRTRYPAATPTADGGLTLTRHSVLSAVEEAVRGQLVVTVDTLRERGDAPLPGQVDPVGWYRVFPDGVPEREERRVLDLLVGVARRLGGSLVVATPDGRGASLAVDPVGTIDLRVLSPEALDPHQVLGATRAVEPTARLAMDGVAFEPQPVPEHDLPDLVRAMDPAERARVEAFSRRADERALAAPDVLDAYAVEVPLDDLGTVVVEAHLEDDPPPLVRARGWPDVLGYEVRWLPVDPLQAETDAPDDDFRAARAAVRPRLRALARAVAELAPGELLDADGFPVDRWSL